MIKSKCVRHSFGVVFLQNLTNTYYKKKNRKFFVLNCHIHSVSVEFKQDSKKKQ